jgi:hypothetical protein
LQRTKDVCAIAFSFLNHSDIFAGVRNSNDISVGTFPPQGSLARRTSPRLRLSLGEHSLAHTVVSKKPRFTRSYIMKTVFYPLSLSVSRSWVKTTLPSSRSLGRSQRRCWTAKTTRSKPLWLRKRQLQRMLPLMVTTRTAALAHLENIKSEFTFNICSCICLDAYSTTALSMNCQHI